MCLQKIKEFFESLFGDPADPPDPPPDQTLLYLVMRHNQKAPVWPDVGAQSSLGVLKDGDAAVIRNQRNYSGDMWYEVLTSEFPWAHTDVGWIKFKDEKSFLEWRKTKSK